MANPKQTCFEMVGEFHQVFNHPHHKIPQYDLLNENASIDAKNLLLQRLNLIKEEVKELEEAIETHDYHEVVDALCDIQYVTHGFAHVIGVNLDRHFREVHECNMTKICRTEEEAIATVEHYKSNPSINKNYNPAYEKRGNYYVVFDDQNPDRASCKILKSRFWCSPNHEKVIAENIAENQGMQYVMGGGFRHPIHECIWPKN